MTEATIPCCWRILTASNPWLVGFDSVTKTRKRRFAAAALNSKIVTTLESEWTRMVELSWMNSSANSAILSRQRYARSTNVFPRSTSLFLKASKSYSHDGRLVNNRHGVHFAIIFLTSLVSAPERVTKRVKSSQPALMETQFCVAASRAFVAASRSRVNSIMVLARFCWMYSVRALIEATGTEISVVPATISL